MYSIGNNDLVSAGAARCSVKAAKKLSKKGGLASELNTIAHHKAASFAAGSSLYKENSVLFLFHLLAIILSC